MNYDSLPTNVYYDVNIINNDQTGTKAPPRLVFQDIRTQPIVSYPELYELSVVRFNLATANSPYGFLQYNSTRLHIIQT